MKEFTVICINDFKYNHNNNPKSYSKGDKILVKYEETLTTNGFYIKKGLDKRWYICCETGNYLSKSYFTPIDEYREQQINKLL